MKRLLAVIGSDGIASESTRILHHFVSTAASSDGFSSRFQPDLITSRIAPRRVSFGARPE